MYVMQGLTTLEAAAIWGVLGIAILGLLYAIFLRSQILREDKGTEKMQEVWGWIRDGADAYLQQQLKTILPFIGILTVALFFSVYIVPPSQEAMIRFAGKSEAQVRLIIGLARALAFVMGAGFSLCTRTSWDRISSSPRGSRRRSGRWLGRSRPGRRTSRRAPPRR